jgi:hypothetical protein
MLTATSKEKSPKGRYMRIPGKLTSIGDQSSYALYRRYVMLRVDTHGVAV